ncbi:MAG: DUF547 domain-containing protein [Bacteroidota bacterium]
MRLFTLTLLSTILSFAAVAQSELQSFFQHSQDFFSMHVEDGLIDYAQVKANLIEVQALQEEIANIQLSDQDDATIQAFYINAYNILVIAQVVENYPLESPLAVAGFFDRTRFNVAGDQLTLNDLEKDRLLKQFGDPRYHFALVCGALDCPPIIPEAYLPTTLDAQLDRQTRLALNDPEFIRVEEDGVALSQIFEWYASDFGGNKNTAITFINSYRETPLADGKVRFYPYDWALNQKEMVTTLINRPGDATPGANNAARYVVSAAIPKGTFEIKGFSNLYNQVTGNGEGPATDQATFFTQNLTILYGAVNRFNAGIDFRYRQVSFGPADSLTRLDVFNLEQTASTRQGLTGVGPSIRYAPFTALPNFSIQSTYWFATRDDLAGASDPNRPFIDFNGDTWFTQIFNDFSLGENFSLFTELDILWEDIGSSDDGHINRFSTPVQAIFSFFPNPKTTLYTIGSYSPYWQEDFDYFYQAGLGAKYQITSALEVELLYTQFRNQFIRQTNGSASTINLGVRISVF